MTWGHGYIFRGPSSGGNVRRLKSDTDRLAHRWINRLLRNEMITHGVTYPGLKRRLIAIGVNESESALRSRVSRGKFSAAFLFQCLKVIGSKTVDIERYDIRDPMTEKEADAPGGGTRTGRTHAALAGGGIQTEPRCGCGAAAILVVTFFSSEKYFCAAHFPPPRKRSVPHD